MVNPKDIAGTTEEEEQQIFVLFFENHMDTG